MDKNVSVVMELAKEINESDKYPNLKNMPLGTLLELTALFMEFQNKLGADATN